jgi:hypothetical protein
METQSLNKVVTNCFFVANVERSKEGFRLRYDAKPNLFLAELVRAAAHKMLITANNTNSIVPEKFIEKAIERFPQSLASKMEVVDKDRGINNKVRNYLQPILDEIEEGNSAARAGYAYVFDFLYKLVVASKFQAQADIHQLRFVGNYIDSLKGFLQDEEAKFRLDQLFGIFHSYRKPEKIDTLTLLMPSRNISIHQRVNDMLDDSEIVELSKNRYLLGIPSNVKIAMKKIKKGISKILTNEKYSSQIAAATDLIQILDSSARIPVSSAAIQDVLKSIQLSPYNPPLIDMDYFRFRIACETRSAGFAITLGDGTFTAQYPPMESGGPKDDYRQFMKAMSKQSKQTDS